MEIISFHIAHWNLIRSEMGTWASSFLSDSPKHWSIKAVPLALALPPWELRNWAAGRGTALSKCDSRPPKHQLVNRYSSIIWGMDPKPLTALNMVIVKIQGSSHQKKATPLWVQVFIYFAHNKWKIRKAKLYYLNGPEKCSSNSSFLIILLVLVFSLWLFSSWNMV